MQALKFWLAAPNAIEISRTMANLPMTPISQKQPYSARPLVRYPYYSTDFHMTEYRLDTIY